MRTLAKSKAANVTSHVELSRGKEKERKGTATTPPHETSSIVFMEWRGSSKGKRIPLRNACNSHLIPKMDEQTCHENPPQQNAPLAIKYEPSNVFHTVPLLFYGHEFFLSFIKRWSGSRRRNENPRDFNLSIKWQNVPVRWDNWVIFMILKRKPCTSESKPIFLQFFKNPQYMTINY